MEQELCAICEKPIADRSEMTAVVGDLGAGEIADEIKFVFMEELRVHTTCLNEMICTLGEQNTRGLLREIMDLRRRQREQNEL